MRKLGQHTKAILKEHCCVEKAILCPGIHCNQSQGGNAPDEALHGCSATHTGLRYMLAIYLLQHHPPAPDASLAGLQAYNLPCCLP